MEREVGAARTERIMETVDWIIVVVMLLAALGGLAQGFFRSASALVGLVAGIALADWNYGAVAQPILPLVHDEGLADTISFLLIAFVVMGVAAIIGKMMSKAVHGAGLGCLDKLAGGVFGLLQGAVLVMVLIIVSVAFFPRAHWLAEGRLPKYFFRACHVSTRMSPEVLAERIQHGLKQLEEETPHWLHPGGSGA
ncbi:MAG: CvpA family protein [Terracidiphilus sp.]